MNLDYAEVEPPVGGPAAALAATASLEVAPAAPTKSIADIVGKLQGSGRLASTIQGKLLNRGMTLRDADDGEVKIKKRMRELGCQTDEADVAENWSQTDDSLLKAKNDTGKKKK